MELMDVMRNRMAVRKYDDRPVEKEVLEKILEAGNLAPTAKNLQSQRIFVCQSSESLAKIDQITPCRYNASTVLLICGDVNDSYSNGEYSSIEMDGSIVTTHMALRAEELGIGSLWILRLDKAKASELFELPENIRPLCLLDLGYRAEGCPDNPNHFKRKPLEDTVKYL